MSIQRKNEQAIQEILHDIRTHDLIKAQFVLQHIQTYTVRTQKRLLFEVSRAQDSFALPVLAFLWHEQGWVFSTYPHLYDILWSKAKDNVSLLVSHLRPQERCLSAFIELCAELKVQAAVEPLLALIHKTADPLVIESIIRALGRIADPRAVKPVAEFVYFKDSSLAVAAVETLARIGTAPAFGYLADILGRDAALDQKVVAACSEQRSQAALQVVVQALEAAQPRGRGLAFSALEEVGSGAVTPLCELLPATSAQGQRDILNLLGRIRDQRALQPIRKLLTTHPGSEVRAAAYTALGGLALPQGAYVLVGGLSDPSEQVRLAAAEAVDGNAGPMMIAGIKNLIQDQDAQALRIVQVLLQARAREVISSLWHNHRLRELIHQAAEASSDQWAKSFVLSLASEGAAEEHF